MSDRIARPALLAFALSLTVSAAAFGGQASALDVPAAKASVEKILDADYPHLDKLYKDIHAHPELAFQEARTAALLAKEMRALGYEVTEGVGKTGIVAVMKNGAGPTVMIRTELDGLPVEEKTGLPYASTAKQIYKGRESFVDHACGHDIHMAAWVGVARVMSTLKGKWHGTVVFVGQPAEEAIGGAKAMIADGFMTRFPKPDMGFALHVGADPYGEVHYRPGAWTSTADTLEILFKGRGSHGSMPEKSIDPVLMASRFVVDVQSLISREKDPSEFGVVTIGTIQAGIAPNVIPDQARITGTIRTYDPAVRTRILAGIERTANGEAMISGAPPPEIAPYNDGATAVINDEAITAKAGKVFSAAFGDKAIQAKRPGPASEDYSEFILAGIPSLAFGIGGSDPELVKAGIAAGKPVPVNHSPYFAPVPEPTIKTGVKAMSLAVLNVLSK